MRNGRRQEAPPGACQIRETELARPHLVGPVVGLPSPEEAELLEVEVAAHDGDEQLRQLRLHDVQVALQPRGGAVEGEQAERAHLLAGRGRLRVALPETKNMCNKNVYQECVTRMNQKMVNIFNMFYRNLSED
eukprot:2769209-Pyramimonas_sp.AAC.1